MNIIYNNCEYLCDTVPYTYILYAHVDMCICNERVRVLTRQLLYVYIYMSVLVPLYCTSPACSGNENTGHSPDARGNTSFDISTPVARIELLNTTVS